jgi:hypothetical protein
MKPFKAKIEIIGINPFVYIPEKVLQAVFKQAGKDKGKIPVKMKIDGHEFIQTLVKYSGHWRLYLNTPMRKAAGKETGDTALFEIRYDPEERKVAMHPELEKALKVNPKAKKVFDALPPSRRNEIIKYISFLKTEESVKKNIARAMQFLQGKERFVGRDKP